MFDFSTDETATENILKAELTMASLCGRLSLVTPRDAFITAICKASLPPHYALTVLSCNAANLSSKGRDLQLMATLEMDKKTQCMQTLRCADITVPLTAESLPLQPRGRPLVTCIYVKLMSASHLPYG